MHDTNWNALIEDVVAGRWRDPDSGRLASLPFEAIRLDASTEGHEADLIAPLRLGARLAVVSDVNTVEVLGRRVATALRAIGSVDEIVLPDGLACKEATVAEVGERTRHADAVVAVGSGVLNDSCKHATFLDGRPYAVFGTAASMNGYGATTASVTLASGLKASLPSHAPRGIFLDLGVSAAAPGWLSAAGLGDSLCRSTAQVDWWASHRLFGTDYSNTPYALQAEDEPLMIERAAGLKDHALDAVGSLQRVLTLCSVGVAFTGTSHHGSMGEHQVSHWIDMFAGPRGGVKHGHQVGVASLAMARLQRRLLSLETAPVVRPTPVDEADLMTRYGPVLGPLCIAETRKTALDAESAARFNERLAELWPALKRELAPMAMPVETMTRALRAAGGPTTPGEIGLSDAVWRDAIRGSREIRGRWSFVNLAADAGLLDAFLDEGGLMRAVADLPRAVAADLVGVFTDIDDTLTTEGRLPASAYAALERLADAGLAVVPVTGRPAGWCDMVARFWPVAGVVGENGAFAFRYDHAHRRMHRRFVTDAATRAAHRARLTALGETILAAVPGCAIASDQLYREADLAIDFREDVAPLPDRDVDRIVALFEAAGATAKVSSIHVNGWFGAYDKLGMVREFAAEHLGRDLDRDEGRFVFCGDSPNDAPMFDFFTHACGVANVGDFAARPFARPAYVTRGRGGEGFVELADVILAARAATPDKV